MGSLLEVMLVMSLLLLLPTALTAPEVAPSPYSQEPGGYLLAQGYNDGSPVGQGYNPGKQAGQGYNPGNEGGQGYNPGTQVVACSAQRARSVSGWPGSKIQLSRSLTNLGSGWDGATFSAPSSGTFHFTWSALSAPNNVLRLSLRRNGQELASSW